MRSSYQVSEILALFCDLIALIFSLNYVKGLRVTKIANEIKFEGIWGELEPKNCLQRRSFIKHLRLTLVPSEIARYGKI